jgi:hypothetical protein
VSALVALLCNSNLSFRVFPYSSTAALSESTAALSESTAALSSLVSGVKTK